MLAAREVIRACGFANIVRPIASWSKSSSASPRQSRGAVACAMRCEARLKPQVLDMWVVESLVEYIAARRSKHES